MARRYVALAPGLFATRSAKTAHGVIAYSADETIAVVDPDYAGKRVRDVVPYLRQRRADRRQRRGGAGARARPRC